jgi:hypothetical protein
MRKLKHKFYAFTVRTFMCAILALGELPAYA